MKSLFLNTIALIVILLGSNILLNSNVANAEVTSNKIMYVQDCPEEAGPCSCAFITCQDEGGTTDQCWDGYQACMDCGPDNPC